MYKSSNNTTESNMTLSLENKLNSTEKFNYELGQAPRHKNYATTFFDDKNLPKNQMSPPKKKNNSFKREKRQQSKKNNE